MNHPECGTVGWWVRIVWNGKTHSRFFADKKNRGMARALRLSIRWRNQWLATHERPAKRRILAAPRHKWAGTSIKQDGQVIGFIYPRVGECQTKTFSFSKYGKRRAMRLALAWRQRMEARYYGGRLPR
jgi:hypothetical protein